MSACVCNGGGGDLGSPLARAVCESVLGWHVSLTCPLARSRSGHLCAPVSGPSLTPPVSFSDALLHPVTLCTHPASLPCCVPPAPYSKLSKAFPRKWLAGYAYDRTRDRVRLYLASAKPLPPQLPAGRWYMGQQGVGVWWGGGRLGGQVSCGGR